tara:strand:- start:2650 stop:3174 length:525 start_codon:yes stop_codon:yes gene_type:complete
MNIFQCAFLIFLFFSTCSCQDGIDSDFSFSVNDGLDKTLINEIIDSWHRAASDSDSIAYFGTMASDESVFQGTDDGERWTKTEFQEWSRKYFQTESAWTFVPLKGRNVTINGNIAWFDEKLDSDHMGRCRGNGVLVKDGKTWKIANYSLSFAVPNVVANDIIQTIKNSNDLILD